jgi:hypothetical protein
MNDKSKTVVLDLRHQDCHHSILKYKNSLRKRIGKQHLKHINMTACFFVPSIILMSIKATSISILVNRRYCSHLHADFSLDSDIKIGLTTS